VHGIIRAGDIADAKIYLSELLTDMPISVPLNIRPVEAFEISVTELEEQELEESRQEEQDG